MDDFILFLYQNVFYLLAVAGIIIITKFFAGLIFFKGNVVDSITKFFRFYTGSNIAMTETSREKTFKRLNNIINIFIYLLIFLSVTVYFIHPDLIE